MKEIPSPDWKEVHSLLQVGSWTYDPVTQEEFWTEGLCDLLGVARFDPGRVVESPLRMIDRFPQIHFLLDEQLRQREEQRMLELHCPVQIAKKKIAPRFLLLKTRLYVNETGIPENVLCVLQDTSSIPTGYLLPQTLPKEADRFLQAVCACPDIFFCEIDTDWKFRYYDPRCTLYYGQRQEDMTGRSARKFFHDFPDVLQGIQEAFDGEISSMFCERYNRILKHHFFPCFDTKRKVIGVVDVGIEVTGQMEAENARRDEEQKYRVLFENTSEMVALLKEESILLCNPSMLKLLEAEHLHDVLGRKLSEVILPQPDIEGVPYKEFLMQKFQAAQSGVHQDFECPYVKQDKTQLMLNLQIIPLVLENELLNIILIHDISQHKKVAEFAKEQDRLLQTVCNGLQSGILILNRDYRILYANPAGEQIFAERKPLPGTVCYEQIYGREEVCEHCPVADTFLTESATRTKRYDPNFDLWIEQSCFPVFDDVSGNIIGVVTLIHDVTKLQHTHLELQNKEALLADVLDEISDALLIIDSDHTILKANKAAEAQFRDFAPLPGKKCYVQSKDKRACKNCLAEKALATGQKVSAELFEPAFDLRPGIWIEHEARPVVNPITKVIDRVVCISRDITEQKQTKEKLQKQIGIQ